MFTPSTHIVIEQDGIRNLVRCQPKTSTLDCVLVQVGIQSSHMTSLSFEHQSHSIFIDPFIIGNSVLYCGSQGNQYLGILPTLCPFHTHSQLSQLQDLPLACNYKTFN